MQKHGIWGRNVTPPLYATMGLSNLWRLGGAENKLQNPLEAGSLDGEMVATQLLNRVYECRKSTAHL